MADELVRPAPAGALHLRAAADGVESRIIEGLVIPFGVVARVQDPGGPPYRETIARGAIPVDLDPATVRLETGRHGGPLVGRGIEARVTDEGLHMALRVARTPAGDETLELAREGVYPDLSAVFVPVSHRVRGDGVTERTSIAVRRVAVLENGAYPGAQVTAVRAASEDGNMADETTAAATEDEDETTETPAAPAAPAERRPERATTRVTVETVQRGAAERDAATAVGRGAPGGVLELTRSAFGLPGITITRPELVYGPGSGRSWVRDLVAMHRDGDREAGEAYSRHNRLLDDLERQIVELGRAGDLLSSEIPGAWPNTYLPGLITGRILKGRPMGSFFDSYPINNPTPQIFPKVTTSTVVAVQSAEGAALSTTDLATTAVTTTPSMYGATIDISRQVLDGANPNADQMVLNDLVEAYAQVSEAAIKTAVEAGSSASGTAITAATPYAGTLGNVIAYYAARFKGAQAQFVPSALFAVLLAQGDTTGRPFLPGLGPINSDGTTAPGGSSANILGANTFLSYASTANVVVTARSDDFVVFESPIVRFSYEQVVGPQAVRIGIWAYLGIGTRLGSLKVTAA